MQNGKISFPGSLGELLTARLDVPAGNVVGFAIFAHCFTCSKDTKAAAYIARSLAEQGVAVLRFDFTGLGGSGGDFGNTNFSSNIADLLSAVDWLRKEHQAPSLMIGHSLGGAAVLAAAAQVPECRAVVSIGAPFTPDHVRAQFKADLDLIEDQGQATVSIAGRKFSITRQFLDDLDGQPQRDRIHTLRKPLLVMHAAFDRIVGVDNARRIFEAAVHPKSFVSLDDADHLLNKESDARYAATVIGAWASRYIGSTNDIAQEQARPPEQVPEGVVRVTERGTGKFANSVTTNRHHLLADEPTSYGGTDLGPSPYELLQAAVGTCTTMTLRMYADRKKLALTRASVDLVHKKVHAQDCETCETEQGKVDQIQRVIRLEGDLTQTEREKLLEIADKCPVHRTLHSEVSIISTLASD